MKTHPVTTQSILRKISAAGRSSLYRWLAEHHDAIAEAATSGRVVGWTKLVEDFAALGLVDGSGSSFCAETVAGLPAQVSGRVAENQGNEGQC